MLSMKSWNLFQDRMNKGKENGSSAAIAQAGQGRDWDRSYEQL